MQTHSDPIRSDTAVRRSSDFSAQRTGLLASPVQVKSQSGKNILNPLEESEGQEEQATQLQGFREVPFTGKPFAPSDDQPQRLANNTGLPKQLKSGMESLSGFSLDNVKVHYNSSRPAQLQAQAYAQGENIHLGPGQEKHLAHEAWHVVQQKQGRVKPTLQLRPNVQINDEPGLEQEADEMGAKALQLSRHRASTSSLRVEPLPLPSHTSTSSGATGTIQGMFGFELEFHIILSQGVPSEGMDTAPVPIASLQSGEYVGQPKVAVKTHQVVVEDGSVYEWLEDSEEEGEGFIRPANVEAEQAGRWKKRGQFTGNLKEDEKLYFDPLLKKEDKIFEATDAKPVDVVEDHASSALDGRLASIPEFVTKPRDEFDHRGDEYILKPVVEAQKFALDIADKTKGGKARIPAKQVFPTARPDLYLGVHDSPAGPLQTELTDRITNDQKPMANIQATAAVELSQVPAFFERSMKMNMVTKDRKVLEATLGSSSEILSDLEGGDFTEANTPGLTALITLIAEYLVGGSTGAPTSKENVKNNVPFLIRPPLVEIIQQILHTAPVKGQALLQPVSVRDQLIPLILDRTGRGADEPVFKTHNPEDGPPPKVEEWLQALFIGIIEEGVIDAEPERKDLIRDYSRFGRASKISLEAVGPLDARKPGVPLEARAVNSLDTGFTDVPINQWLAIAVQYLDTLRKLNAPPVERPDPASGNIPANTPVMVGGKLKGTVLGKGKEGHYSIKIGTLKDPKDFPYALVTYPD